MGTALPTITLKSFSIRIFKHFHGNRHHWRASCIVGDCNQRSMVLRVPFPSCRSSIMSKPKYITTIGVFETRQAAEKAVEDLRAAGYKDEEISHVWKKADGETYKADGSGMTAEEKGAANGAVTGLAAGAAGGAAVGAGILAGVIPVIGPVLAVGALGTILVNALGGAAAVGVAGALLGWGVSKDDAEYYESQVAAGKHLVTVQSTERHDRAHTVYNRHGGMTRMPADSAALKV
jgi:hypothetical protein